MPNLPPDIQGNLTFSRRHRFHFRHGFQFVPFINRPRKAHGEFPAKQIDAATQLGDRRHMKTAGGDEPGKSRGAGIAFIHMIAPILLGGIDRDAQISPGHLADFAPAESRVHIFYEQSLLQSAFRGPSKRQSTEKPQAGKRRQGGGAGGD